MGSDTGHSGKNPAGIRAPSTGTIPMQQLPPVQTRARRVALRAKRHRVPPCALRTSEPLASRPIPVPWPFDPWLPSEAFSHTLAATRETWGVCEVEPPRALQPSTQPAILERTQFLQPQRRSPHVRSGAPASRRDRAKRSPAFLGRPSHRVVGPQPAESRTVPRQVGIGFRV